MDIEVVSYILMHLKTEDRRDGRNYNLVSRGVEFGGQNLLRGLKFKASDLPDPVI